MSIEIRAEDVNVEEIMRQIRRRIDEKRRGLYTDEELREIAEHRLDAVLDASEFNPDFVADFRAGAARWNYRFHTETVYRSSRGATGRALEAIRTLLKPVQKLFWNPNPMIAALSRQSDLNLYYVELFHNLARELTRLNLENQELKNRVLTLQGRLDLLARREKTLEDMVVYRDDPGADAEGPGGGR